MGLSYEKKIGSIYLNLLHPSDILKVVTVQAMYDLIIIGGGPCGSSAGRGAGRLGLETLLIEKKIFPRYKICGGAFSEQAMSYLDFEIFRHILKRSVFGAKVHFRGNAIEKRKDSRIAALVSRSILDDYLLKRAMEAGIETRMGEKVISFEEFKSYVEVKTDKRSFKSRFVILAEGAHGILKYRIRRKGKKHKYGICVATEIEEDTAKIDQGIHNSIEIYYGVAHRGYGWIFPHEKYFSVGIGGLEKMLPIPTK